MPIQASTLVLPADLAANTWARGIPAPGVNVGGLQVPPVIGIATCADLFAGSPPMLLERYDVFSFAVGFTAFATLTETTNTVVVELAFLINDHVRYRTSLSSEQGVACSYSDAFVGDLINPIRVGPRERFGLQVGFMANSNAGTNSGVIVGAQLTAAGLLQAYESFVRYSVIKLPPTRRLG